MTGLRWPGRWGNQEWNLRCGSPCFLECTDRSNANVTNRCLRLLRGQNVGMGQHIFDPEILQRVRAIFFCGFCWHKVTATFRRSQLLEGTCFYGGFCDGFCDGFCGGFSGEFVLADFLADFSADFLADSSADFSADFPWILLGIAGRFLLKTFPLPWQNSSTNSPACGFTAVLWVRRSDQQSPTPQDLQILGVAGRHATIPMLSWVFLEWGHQNQLRTAHVGPYKRNMISHIFFVWQGNISSKMPDHPFFPTSPLCDGEMFLWKCQIILEMIFRIIFKIILVKFGMLWSSCRAHMWQQNAHTENTQMLREVCWFVNPSLSTK